MSSQVDWASTSISYGVGLILDENVKPMTEEPSGLDTKNLVRGEVHASHLNQAPIQNAYDQYCTFVLKAHEDTQTPREFSVRGIDEQGTEIDIAVRTAGFNREGLTTWYVQFTRTELGIVAGEVTPDYMYYSAELRVRGKEQQQQQQQQQFTWNLGQRMDRPSVDFLVSYEQEGRRMYVCFIHFGEGSPDDMYTARYFLTRKYHNDRFSHNKLLDAFFKESDNIGPREVVTRDASDSSGFKAVQYKDDGAATAPAYSDLGGRRGVFVRFELMDDKNMATVGRGGENFFAEKSLVHKSLAGEGLVIGERHQQQNVFIYIIAGLLLGAVLCYYMKREARGRR